MIFIFNHSTWPLFLLTWTLALTPLFSLSAKELVINNNQQNSIDTEFSLIKEVEPYVETLSSIVIFIETAYQDQQQELFSDGPIMQTWHEKTLEAETQIEWLSHYANQLPIQRKTRLLAALAQFTKSMHQFHQATHEQSKHLSQRGLQHLRGALMLIEASLSR
jgi:hypothetical protein